VRLVGPAVVLALAAPAHAAVVSGSVFIDEDADGLFSAGEQGAPGVRIAWEDELVAVSGPDGSYSFDAPDQTGIAWVRVPDGYRPGPVWQELDGGGDDDESVDFPLRAAPIGADMTFVIGSDSHMGRDEYLLDGQFDADDLMLSFRQATDLDPAPHFIAITGDIAQSGMAEQFDRVIEVVSELDVAFVPVPGNHDWFDQGAAYRERFGPPMYSFDAGGTRFVVLNDNDSVPAWQAFLTAQLADAAEGAPVVAFMHRPPADPELAAIEAAGVDYLFTGHWHSNAVLNYGDLVQYNTQPIVRGGVDGSPAGYRIASFAGGVLQLSHHTVVESPTLRVTWPRADDCVDGDRTEVLVAAQIGARLASVDATLGDAEARLTWTGAWSYAGELPLPGYEALLLRVTARTASGTSLEVEQALRRCRPAAPSGDGEWSQIQGGPEHRGYLETEVTPPLTTAWARSIGGHILGGSPVLADGRLFVTAADFNDGASSVVVALDAATGEELWRVAPGSDIRNAPAVAGGVLVAPTSSGRVIALDAVTGDSLWEYDLGIGLERNQAVLHAAVTIADGTVYAGVHGRFAALDAATGAVLWEGDPADGNSLTSLAGGGVGGGMVVGTVGRGREGLFGWDLATGQERWRVQPPATIGVHTSPVISEDQQSLFFANGAGVVHAVELASGAPLWSAQLFQDNTDWDYAVIATPALAHGALYVPTTYDFLYALDQASGAELWRIAAAPSVVHVSHARSVASSFSAPPVVTGGVLWVGGADGFLRAHDPMTGEALWCTDLGAPILAGMAPADGALYVGTYDGTIRAMTHVDGELGCEAEFTPPTGPVDDGGCGCRSAPGGGAGAWLLLLALLASRRRR
jgi:MYXO-CTERM domain-containing protein